MYLPPWANQNGDKVDREVAKGLRQVWNSFAITVNTRIGTPVLPLYTPKTPNSPWTRRP